MSSCTGPVRYASRNSRTRASVNTNDTRLRSLRSMCESSHPVELRNAARKRSYERETDGIPPMRLEKIAQVLGTSVDELLNSQAKTINLEVNRAFLKRLELAKKLPEHKQKILSQMIDEMTDKKD
jgi:hypothetical protein